MYGNFKSLQPVVLAQLLLQFQQPNSTFAPDIEPTEVPQLATADDESGDTTFFANLLRDPLAVNDLSDANGDNSYLFIDQIRGPAHSSVFGGMFDFFARAWTDVYWLTSLVVAMTLLACFVLHHADLRQRLVGARMRIACCAAIYRKTLRMSKRAAGQTPGGYLVNLLSNDVGRLDYGFIYVHYVWILPFQAMLITYLIWQQVGVAAVVGVLGLLIKTIPVQTGLSRLSSVLRLRVAMRTDKRVGLMNEIIQGIQVIKMYAWEKPFHAVVAEARKREITQVLYASYIKAIYESTMVFTERSTLLITIAFMVFQGQFITADKVFSMAQFFNILQLTAAIFYPLAVSLGAEALVSINRVQGFLEKEEQDTSLVGLHREDSQFERTHASSVLIDKVCASWEENQKPQTLSHVSITVRPGALCAIIGPVGSGKTSLLHLLLGELPITAGEVHISSAVSYASQEPWLFTGTVRANILFGLAYDRKRYRDVVRHCALLTDFEQLPLGDKTVVGERGAALSGGQRARVSLARAVYKQADVYLLDDPLSAVDAHVGKHLFDECIGPKGYLAKQEATRILVTHQVHFLKDADWIVVLDEGRVIQQGTYADIASSSLDLSRLVQPPEDEETKTKEQRPPEEVDEEIPYIDGATGYLQLGSQTSLMSKSLSKSLSLTDQLGRAGGAEEQGEGNISFYVWSSYFRAGGHWCLLLLMLLVLIVSQGITSGSDYFVNTWTQMEYLRGLNDTAVEATLSTRECLYIYSGLILGVILMTTLRGFLFFDICMRASRVLHDRMFARLLRVPMDFFDRNPSGRILNRFSRDLGAIDELLPKAMIEAIQITLVMSGILAVIAVVNPLLLVPLAFAVVLFTAVLKLYLRPAQDLKRLEGICRSPIFSHLSATLNGISTIRANNAQDRVADEFDQLQNVHSGVWQLTISSNTALGLWLDCISSAFVACVAFSFIVLHQKTFSGNVGLAISQALILTGMVQYGIRQTTESIQQMTSVERVLQYTNLDAEPSATKTPPKDWPWRGLIEFRDMSLSYGFDAPPVLKNLNFTIQSGWKVGIVGRTGAGKSSLIGALFRLAHVDGRILLDGIDTGEVSLEALRSRISIIPQSPVLFSASIRYNLDPFDAYEDSALWTALEAVELRDAVQGLHFEVSEGGGNFSVGQRQLLCLARALLRGNKVLVLDEATANVDPRTDALIQATIRDKFSECTVLTVAHRLHTVMDSDRILVMDGGEAREFDVPHVLLQREDGLLRGMVDATGAEAESLRRIAAETFTKLTAPPSRF